MMQLQPVAEFFTLRVTDTRKWLPESLVTAPAVNAFKNRLDVLW